LSLFKIRSWRGISPMIWLYVALMAVRADISIPLDVGYPDAHSGWRPVASGEVRDQGESKGLGAGGPWGLVLVEPAYAVNDAPPMGVYDHLHVAVQTIRNLVRRFERGRAVDHNVLYVCALFQVFRVQTVDQRAALDGNGATYGVGSPVGPEHPDGDLVVHLEAVTGPPVFCHPYIRTVPRRVQWLIV
jgi:hypothetical protein